MIDQEAGRRLRLESHIHPKERINYRPEAMMPKIRSSRKPMKVERVSQLSIEETNNY